jgi:hypothetical protein
MGNLIGYSTKYTSRKRSSNTKVQLHEIPARFLVTITFLMRFSMKSIASTWPALFASSPVNRPMPAPNSITSLPWNDGNSERICMNHDYPSVLTSYIQSNSMWKTITYSTSSKQWEFKISIKPYSIYAKCLRTFTLSLRGKQQHDRRKHCKL